jgi:hypothetical protein
MANRRTRTSAAAYASLGGEADTLRRIAYCLIHQAEAQGMTALEVVTSSGRDRWSIQPRVSELVSDKAVVDSGRTRTNPSGKQAIVWVLPEYGPKAVGSAAND